jgi:hypothetical protein
MKDMTFRGEDGVDGNDVSAQEQNLGNSRGASQMGFERRANLVKRGRTCRAANNDAPSNTFNPHLQHHHDHRQHVKYWSRIAHFIYLSLRILPRQMRKPTTSEAQPPSCQNATRSRRALEPQNLHLRKSWAYSISVCREQDRHRVASYTHWLPPSI